MDAIDQMKEEGWKVQERRENPYQGPGDCLILSYCIPRGDEMVFFTRPKPQEPNAVVDWDIVDSIPNPILINPNEREMAEQLAKVLGAIRRVKYMDDNIPTRKWWSSSFIDPSELRPITVEDLNRAVERLNAASERPDLEYVSMDEYNRRIKEIEDKK